MLTVLRIFPPLLSILWGFTLVYKVFDDVLRVKLHGKVFRISKIIAVENKI